MHDIYVLLVQPHTYCEASKRPVCCRPLGPFDFVLLQGSTIVLGSAVPPPAFTVYLYS